MQRAPPSSLLGQFMALPPYLRQFDLEATLMSSKNKTMIGAAMILAAVVLTTARVETTRVEELCISGCNSLTNTLAKQVEPVSPGDPAAGTTPKYSAHKMMESRKACLRDCQDRFSQPKPPQQYPRY